MGRLACWLLTGVLLGTGAAAEAARKPAARPASRAAAPRLAKITVLPAAVQLDGPAGAQRLVVMGTRTDGVTVDVTGTARFQASSPKVAVVTGTRVVARSDGKGTVTARVRNLTARVPVTVTHAARPVAYSFRNDVVPVLARLGCSAGTCHGANSGKGGFKLSLRGYAPELDFLAITRQASGRRISREAPEESLLLRKPLALVPHAGGRVLAKGSREYFAILGWLRQGAPPVDEQDPTLTGLAIMPGDRLYRPQERQRLLVRATYSDGRTEDVTDRAIFGSNDAGVARVTADGEVRTHGPGETAVQAKYMDHLASVRVTVPYPQKVRAAAFGKPNNYVDALVYARLRQLNLEPSPPSTDEEFLRRVYLDAIGTLPTADEARAFLASRDPERRSRLVDAVLERPEYASIWALKLSDLSMVRREHMQRKNTLALNQWFTEQFQANRPWDELATDLITAAGSVAEKPQTLWWVSRQRVRPNGRGWVRHYELTGEIVAQLFLGQRIQCAQCHNHPTEKYTQDDYYRFASIFAQVNGDGRADPVPDRLVATDPGEVRHPRTGQLMPPRPLDRADLQVRPGEDRRVRFAQWLTTGAGRKLFARSAANRVWARLFGSGIVDPVDDLRSTNPPRNAALLDALADDLVAHGWDLKYLMATIMRSRTYQASSRPTPNNRIDTQFFSHYPVRRLAAEELLDAIAQVTGVPDRWASYPLGTRAIELSDTELPSLALDTFGRPNRTTPCECDRSAAPTLSQALDLFNGESLQGKLGHPEGTVGRLLRTQKPDAEIVEELFLRAFARRPTPEELAGTLAVVARAASREEAMQDVLWALINSKEFMFNH